MWHVSSRSGVATSRTAIHLLLTYLLTYYVALDVCQDGCDAARPASATDSLEQYFQAFARGQQLQRQG